MMTAQSGRFPENDLEIVAPMKITILCKGRLEFHPPVMSVALAARELGYEVELFTSSSDVETKDAFADKQIDVVDVCPDGSGVSMTTLFSKARHWRAFSRGAWKHLTTSNASDRILWIGTADTALALGKRLLRTTYIIQILELYDRLPIFRRMLSAYVRCAACVVVPEACRAAIFRSWYGLASTPTVLPNKPIRHPRRKNLEIENDRARNIVAALDNRQKLVLYQGGIRAYSELGFVARAVEQLGDEWCFAVMGSGNMQYLDEVRRDSPGVIYIPRVTAPNHLEVTSHAHVTIVSYSYECLNFVFCAPNKTWESAGFGIPMICNDLPPLRTEVQSNGAGLCVDIQDSQQIKSALTTIDADYEVFSRNAHGLYDSVDTQRIISSVIARTEKQYGATRQHTLLAD